MVDHFPLCSTTLSIIPYSTLQLRVIACTGPGSIGEHSESEDDDYLAAAVAAVEAKQGKGGKKVKHPHLRALRSKLGSISRSKDKEGSGSTHAASPTSEQVRKQKSCFE